MRRISQRAKSVPQIPNLEAYLGFVRELQKSPSESLWFRGQGDSAWKLEPQVVRIRSRLSSATAESQLNEEFRRRSVAFLPQVKDLVELYFVAQHFGMPTRLLDWTKNPFAALFFAVTGKPKRNGEVIAFRPNQNQLLGDVSRLKNEMGERLREQQIRILKRHCRIHFQKSRLVARIVDVLFGAGDSQFVYVGSDEPRSLGDELRYPSVPIDAAIYEGLPGIIVPVVPDAQLGRIYNQDACFTLHMPFGGERLSKELIHRCVIPAERKSWLQSELRSVGVRWDTLFPDLEHVIRELRDGSGLSFARTC